MTYLTLCSDTRRECRMNGTGPSAVTGQTGLLADVVAWVANAYTELQQARDNWRWLRSTFTFNTVASTDAYAYTAVTDSRLSATISRFAKWWLTDDEGYSAIRIYPTSSGVGSEFYLTPIPWDQFRARYKFGAQQSLTGQPQHVSVDPQNRLVLGPNPSAIYTVTGEYQMSPQTLTANDDVPEMPTQFHQLIVYMAMEKYGAAKSEIEVFNRGALEGGRMRNRLEMDQLPMITMAGPLT